MWKRMRFFRKFLTALFNRKIFILMSFGKRGNDTVEKSVTMTERPKTSGNYRRRPIPISNRFTVIIFVSEYETVCARYVYSSLLSVGNETRENTHIDARLATV